MADARGSLGRLLPALLLTGLLVALFVTGFLPAWKERNALRRERRAAEAEVEALRDDVRRDEAWIRAALGGDEYVLEREADRLRRSPDLPGPTFRVVPPPRDEHEEGERGLDDEVDTSTGPRASGRD